MRTQSTLVAILLTTILVLPACKKQVPVEATVSSSSAAPVTPAATVEDGMAAMRDNFKKVQFPFDSAELDRDSKTALALNAQIMKRHPSITVVVEGHCDERGTTEYNLALGMKRAKAVTSQLEMLGIGSSRLEAVSYGEEAPAEIGKSENAFSANRRAEFQVRASDGAVKGTVDRGD